MLLYIPLIFGTEILNAKSGQIDFNYYVHFQYCGTICPLPSERADERAELIKSEICVTLLTCCNM